MLMRQEKQKKEGRKESKVKVKTAVSLLNPKSISKFCFLHMPKLCKLIICNWIRNPECMTCKWLYGKF